MVALVDGPVVFAFELDEFFLGLENLLLFDHLAGRFGLFQNRGLLVPDDFRCDRIACIAPAAEQMTAIIAIITMLIGVS